VEAATPPQNTTPTDSSVPTELSSDPALRSIQLQTYQAQLDKAVADARLSAATADKSEVDAQTAAQTAKFPASTFTPREGKVDVGEKVGLVADLIAHKLLDDAAAQIAAELADPLKQARVLIVSDPDLIASDWSYRLVSEEIARAKSELEGVCGDLTKAAPATEKTPAKEQGEESTVGGERLEESLVGAQSLLPILTGAGMEAVGSVVGGAAAVASVFRSDYALSARESAWARFRSWQPSPIGWPRMPPRSPLIISISCETAAL
jgi:hypothetical protein